MREMREKALLTISTISRTCPWRRLFEANIAYKALKTIGMAGYIKHRQFSTE
jgi:hypothetical protein